MADLIAQHQVPVSVRLLATGEHDTLHFDVGVDRRRHVRDCDRMPHTRFLVLGEGEPRHDEQQGNTSHAVLLALTLTLTFPTGFLALGSGCSSSRHTMRYT